MKINVRRSSVSKMFALCKKHKNGELKRQELEEMLDHEDYMLEFERYNLEGLPICHITKDEFIDYFLNIENLKIEDIKNERFKIHHPYYQYFFRHLDEFEEKIKLLLNTKEEIFLDGLDYTFSGLPKTITFDSFDIVFTISIGNSFGWPLPAKNCIHFDVVQFFNHCNLDDLTSFQAFMSHELHHIGFSRFANTVNQDHFSLEEQLYFFLAFEGLAVKYCNNGEGHLTKKIYPGLEANIGMDRLTFDYFDEHFNTIYQEFKNQIKAIRNGEIIDFNPLKNYWLNLYTKDQDKSEVPKLSHSPNYYIGCDIWGLIHDTYGKDKVFELLKSPKKFPKLFNKALKKMGKKDLKI